MTSKPTVPHARVSLCVLLAVCIAHAPVRAAEQVYSLGGQAAHVGGVEGHEGAPAPRLMALVSATPHALAAALDEAGFTDVESTVCDSPESSWIFDGAAPDLSDDRDVLQAARRDHVAAWKLPASALGAPVWALFATESPGPEDGNVTGACAALDGDILNVLLAGIAREHVASPVANASHAVPWIELRHAAGELSQLLLPPSFAVCIGDDWNMEDAHAAACLPRVYLPPSLPLQGAVVDTLIWRDNLVNKQVALTFDACSTFTKGEYNPAVIDALIANQIPATLFIGGHWAEMHPKEVQWLAAQPWFELGNHTYSHPHMTQLTPAQQRQELLWTNQIIFGLTGKLPKYWRPPYGEVDDTLIRTAASVGLYTVEFDLPAGDADYNVSDARLIEWIDRKATSGTIVVMHMNRPGNKTAEVLPSIARDLRARGYVFSKVGDMLSGGGHL